MEYPDPDDPKASVERRRVVKHRGVDEYPPVAGIDALREEFAWLYSRLYRKNGRGSLSMDNTSIRPGGRPAVASILAAFGQQGLKRGAEIRLGHFDPDYAGYRTPLTVIKGLAPVAIPLDRKSGYHMDIAELRKIIRQQKLEVLLLSNPCNPTGTVMAGNELRKWVELSEELGVYIVFDEFYSDFVYVDGMTRVSAVEHIGDIDKSRVIAVSGLSKGYQAAGWRIAVVLGARNIIREVNTVAGGLDGAANHPLQAAAVTMLNSPRSDRTHESMHADFLDKQKTMAGHLRDMGVELASAPDGTFYLWGDISKLVGDKDPVEVARAFIRAKVIPWVPGAAFCVDTNPESRRVALPDYRNLVRFSYGPRKDVMVSGLRRMKEVIKGGFVVD